MSNICDDLRAVILQAAMQGKLTKQLSEDGDVSDLLEEIKAEKEKLISESKVKKQKTISPISDEEIPFEIPESWKWVRLPEIANSLLGKTLNKTTDQGEEKPYLCSINIYWDGINLDKIKTANFNQNEIEQYILKKNDLLVCEGGDVGRAAIWTDDREMYYQNALHRIRFYSNIDAKYMKAVLDCYKRIGIIDEYSKGVTIKHLVQSSLNSIPIPLPPLAEQKRIVEKVDELMARVADLEQSADALASLKKAFPDDIKASLLQYAMQGKLTKQLPEDGDAGDLLEKIKAEKEKLIAEGKIKKQKPLTPITDDEIPFSIPENWKWERFGNLGLYRKGPFGSVLTKSIFVKDSEDAVKVYEQKNAIKKDETLGDYFISRKYYEEKMKNFRVLPGDIIVSCAGTIGETYIMPNKIREGIINQALMRMRMFSGIYIPYFLIYFDYIIKASAISNSKGSAIKNIPPFEVLNMYPVAIPPFAEQKRIVERLESLMNNISSVGELIASE